MNELPSLRYLLEEGFLELVKWKNWDTFEVIEEMGVTLNIFSIIGKYGFTEERYYRICHFPEHEEELGEILSDPIQSNRYIKYWGFKKNKL
jgi:hypothetical protein